MMSVVGMSLNMCSDQYIAGLLDGDGSVGFFRSGGKYYPHIRIGIVDPAPLEMIKARFGGSIHKDSSARRKRAFYVWCVSNRKAEVVARTLWPHTIIKKDALGDIISFYNGSVQRDVLVWAAEGRRQKGRERKSLPRIGDSNERKLKCKLSSEGKDRDNDTLYRFRTILASGNGVRYCEVVRRAVTELGISKRHAQRLMAKCKEGV